MEELELLKETIAQLEKQIRMLRQDNAEMDDLIIHLKAELYDYMTKQRQVQACLFSCNL